MIDGFAPADGTAARSDRKRPPHGSLDGRYLRMSDQWHAPPVTTAEHGSHDEGVSNGTSVVPNDERLPLPREPPFVSVTITRPIERTDATRPSRCSQSERTDATTKT